MCCPDCSRFRTISRSRGGLHHDGHHPHAQHLHGDYPDEAGHPDCQLAPHQLRIQQQGRWHQRTAEWYSLWTCFLVGLRFFTQGFYGLACWHKHWSCHINLNSWVVPTHNNWSLHPYHPYYVTKLLYLQVAVPSCIIFCCLLTFVCCLLPVVQCFLLSCMSCQSDEHTGVDQLHALL